MTQARFYFLYVKPRRGVAPAGPSLLVQLNKALDWFHVSPNTWILYSTSTPEQWELRLRRLVRPDGGMFISIMDMSPQNRSGWMKRSFWKWVRKNESRYKKTPD